MFAKNNPLAAGAPMVSAAKPAPALMPTQRRSYPVKRRSLSFNQAKTIREFGSAEIGRASCRERV